MGRKSVLATALLLALTACSQQATEPVTSERPAVAVEVARVTPGEVKETIAVVGTLEPKFTGEVKTEYSGTITDVYVSEWVRVSKGTLLARFDSREVRAALEGATAARLQSEVGATRAQRELERAEKLKAAGLATQQFLDDARAANDAAAAQLRAAQAQESMVRTRLAKTEVRAPMDGVIALRRVNPGDYIENMGGPGPMFRIVDNRRLELTVSVPSSAIGTVQLGQPVWFTVDAIPGRTFEGRVSFINPSADATSRTVKVIAVVENDDGALRSGLFAKGGIVTGTRSGILSVPRTAMVTWDPIKRAGAVFVVRGDKVERHVVATGAAAGDTIEVGSGLAVGDTVVTRGAFNLREGDRVTVASAPGA